MSKTATAIIARELQLREDSVKNTAALLESGCTVPFIARYRKEMTGSLDETSIISIRDRITVLEELEKRRSFIMESLEKRGLATEELRKKVNDASSLPQLEDIYLPFRQGRSTKASVAIEKGLEKLAELLLMQTGENPQNLAVPFVKPDIDVRTTEDALKGACHIIAAKINENIKARSMTRKLFVQRGKVRSSVVSEEKDPSGKYRDYYDFQTLCRSCPPHRIMALFRGEREKVLSVKIQPDQEEAVSRLEKLFISGRGPDSDLVKSALVDGYKRLLAPSMETELRRALKKNADLGSIKVFTNNLYHLLMEPPLGRKNVIAIDPGFRTGCKVVCLDREGRLQHFETIYPVPPKNLRQEAADRMMDLVDRYSIEAIAIGNGTGGRETELFIRSLDLGNVIVTMVNESGASVYSASQAAREEFPDHDITVRGAVSIGRRLMDPLSELVKIEPKSIGVGQYQHDVDQKLLNRSLDDVVTGCVNRVGVDLNTASRHLLSYVSGISPSLAAKIFAHRTGKGPFQTRQQLFEIPGLGPSTFQQCAGFLRITDSSHPLDATAVHPDNYNVVEKMANDMNLTIEELIKNPERVEQIEIENYADASTGLPTLRDILSELLKPGRDPRSEFNLFEFSDAVNSIEDLEVGMTLPGIVTNVTDFGAFVDVGVHQDGLVHISRISEKFVKTPEEVVSPGMKVSVRVDNIDITRKRISLSMDDIK